jgi:hypothetical protein
MGGNFYDGDDVNVKGDDGSEDGVKITSTTVSTKKCLDTNVAQSALPTGAATAANQSTEISSLSSIDTKLTTTNSTLSAIDGGIPAALGQTTMSASMPVTLASNQSAIPVTATITGGQGETELATFVVYAQDIAIGNAKSMVSLVNTSGSTVKVKIREIRVINVQNTAVTGVIADFRLLRCVSHSAGTSLTPSSHDTTDSLNGSVTARTGATIATEGTAVLRRWQWSTDEWGVGAQDVESQDHGVALNNPLYEPISKTKPITLNANEGITIKQVTNSTVGSFDLVLVFTQE